MEAHQIIPKASNDDLLATINDLERQQAKLASIYDLAPVGYYILDKAGLICEVNKVGIDLLEAEKHLILNQRLQSFIAYEHTEQYRIFFQKIVDSVEKQSAYFKLSSVNGREYYVQMEGIAVALLPPRKWHCNIVATDITRLVLAQNELAKTKERLVLALEASSSGTWELELDTMKFYLDEFNFQTGAVPAKKFNGQYETFIDLIHPDDRADVDKQFRTSLNNQNPINIICRFGNNSEQMRFTSINGHIISSFGQSNRFVGIMTDITNIKQLENDAAQLKADQQRSLALATIRAEESERSRISEALHDSVSQLLYGIRIKMSTLFDADNPSEIMRDIYKLLDMAVMETRNISFELAPAILGDFGLRVTIEEMAKRLTSPTMVIVTKLTRLNERLSLPFEANIFRILQELVNNAMKHSNAKIITVEVKKSDCIELCVADNGKGFDAVKQQDIAAGSGLTSIRNRLNLYNGSMKIESESGVGTAVKIKLNITPA